MQTKQNPLFDPLRPTRNHNHNLIRCQSAARIHTKPINRATLSTFKISTLLNQLNLAKEELKQISNVFCHLRTRNAFLRKRLHHQYSLCPAASSTNFYSSAPSSCQLQNNMCKTPTGYKKRRTRKQAQQNKYEEDDYYNNDNKNNNNGYQCQESKVSKTKEMNDLRVFIDSVNQEIRVIQESLKHFEQRSLELQLVNLHKQIKMAMKKAGGSKCKSAHINRIHDRILQKQQDTETAEGREEEEYVRANQQLRGEIQREEQLREELARRITQASAVRNKLLKEKLELRKQQNEGESNANTRSDACLRKK